LTDNGIKYLLAIPIQTFVLPDIGTEIAAIEKKLDKDAEAEEKNNYFKILIKSERIHTFDTTKAYALFEKDVEYVIMDNKIMIVDEQTVVSWMVVVILTDCTKRLKPKKM
jgi:preprotein translocase subunit SecA